MSLTHLQSLTVTYISAHKSLMTYPPFIGVSRKWVSEVRHD